MHRSFTDHLITGSAELKSPWFSSRWELLVNGEVLARIRRLPRLHVSTVSLADGSLWVVEPAGTSAVRLLDSPGHEFARITRRSWWGRSWSVTADRFSYDLISHPTPRRWRFELGGSPIAELSGSLISYNRVRIESLLALPLPALILGWHVIARPWEAAAAPRGLVPLPRVGPSSNPEITR